jgi:uncharacterized protein GlcG (DUF336 family)
MTRRPARILLGAVALSLLPITGGAKAIADELVTVERLPRTLAVEAANEAVRFCEANGYQVTAAIVGNTGEMRALVRGDESTPHTNETAFRKAYTQVTLGPIYGFDALGAFAAKDNPNKASLLTIPNFVFLPGAVAIKAKGKTIAAIGVGGAPGGDKDEACAAAGLAKIADRLPR